MKTLAISEPDAPVNRKKVVRKVKRFLKWVLGAFFIVSGVSHLLLAGFDDQVMLSSSRWPLALICLSGAFETMLGIMLFLRRMQVNAAWGMIALLIVVSPAYIQIAINADSDLPAWNRWGRLALQFFLIGWAAWYTRTSRKKPGTTAAQTAAATGAVVAAPAEALAGIPPHTRTDIDIGIAKADAEVTPGVTQIASHRGANRAVTKRRKKTVIKGV